MFDDNGVTCGHEFIDTQQRCKVQPSPRGRGQADAVEHQNFAFLERQLMPHNIPAARFTAVGWTGDVDPPG